MALIVEVPRGEVRGCFRYARTVVGTIWLVRLKLLPAKLTGWAGTHPVGNYFNWIQGRRRSRGILEESSFHQASRVLPPRYRSS